MEIKPLERIRKLRAAASEETRIAGESGSTPPTVETEEKTASSLLLVGGAIAALGLGFTIFKD